MDDQGHLLATSGYAEGSWQRISHSLEELFPFSFWEYVLGFVIFFEPVVVHVFALDDVCTGPCGIIATTAALALRALSFL